MEVIILFRKKQQKPLEIYPPMLTNIIEDGIRHGASDELMAKGMMDTGNIMGQFVKQNSPEAIVMKEMWEVASEEQRMTMAQLAVKVGKARLK